MNKLEDQSGKSKFPIPREREVARMNRFLLVYLTRERILRPEVATLANRNVVTPPRIGEGMDKTAPEIFPVERERTSVTREGLRLSKSTLTQNPEENQEGATAVACSSVTTSRENDDSVVLSEQTHWSDSEESRESPSQSIRQ